MKRNQFFALEDGTVLVYSASAPFQDVPSMGQEAKDMKILMQRIFGQLVRGSSALRQRADSGFINKDPRVVSCYDAEQLTLPPGAHSLTTDKTSRWVGRGSELVFHHSHNDTTIRISRLTGPWKYAL